VSNAPLAPRPHGRRHPPGGAGYVALVSAPAPRPPSIDRPRRFGPYDVVEALGAGGMGVVYRARHATTGEVVAVKTVQAQGEAVLAGIRREIHALRSLDHPGVVHIVDDGLEHGVPWYAMELLDGPTLRRFHRERSSASLRDTPANDPGSLGSATTARGPGPRSATGQPVTPRAGASS